MNVDQNISDDELKLVKTTGIRLGLSPLAVAEVLDIMDEYPNNLIPPQKLIEIFRTFHN